MSECHDCEIKNGVIETLMGQLRQCAIDKEYIKDKIGFTASRKRAKHRRSWYKKTAAIRAERKEKS